MSVEIVVPQVGEAVSEVTLVEWFKQPGDPVKKGEALFSVDTDKAVVEVEAFEDGVLAEIVVPAGSPVQPRQVVGWLGGGAAQAARGQPASLEPPPPRPAASAARAPQADAAPRVPIAPRARERAQALGLDLTQIEGTGDNGLITTRDVERAAARQTESAPGGADAPRAIPYSRRRQAIARRVLESKQTAPHFYLAADANMTEAQRLRAHCAEALGWERPPTYTEIFVRACALALAAIPAVNAAYSVEGALPRGSVDIGVAVGLDDGLVVPVLARADQLSLQETSARLKQLIARARQGTLSQAEMGPKSMVVSNLGMYRVDSFLAIIDAPDPVILAAGRVAERVAAVQGRPAVVPLCTLTLSVDHRALDGVAAAKFLTQVVNHIENAFAMLG